MNTWTAKNMYLSAICTWIDAKKCNFIVTEKCAVDGGDRIYVRGYEYSLPQGSGPGVISGPLEEAYVAA